MSLSGAAKPIAAVSDVPGARPLPSQEAPGASSEREPDWCRVCNREFSPDVQPRRDGRYSRYLCLRCMRAEQALYAYFHPKQKRTPVIEMKPASEMRIKGRHGGRRVWGESVKTAKLKDADITLIRAAVASGRSKYSVAKTYNVSAGLVRRIVERQLWKHVA